MSNSPASAMQAMAEKMNNSEMKIPPPIFLKMGGEIIDVDMEAKSLTAVFPVKEWYQNPMGYMQGGMIATAADNAIGPLSFMVAPPSVTKTMTVEYKRPVTPNIEKIMVVARFEGQNGRELTFTAKIMRDGETVLAEVTALQVILKN